LTKLESGLLVAAGQVFKVPVRRVFQQMWAISEDNLSIIINFFQIEKRIDKEKPEELSVIVDRVLKKSEAFNLILLTNGYPLNRIDHELEPHWWPEKNER